MRSIKELMNLGGRVALVTGGAGHIGAVICETLAELGAKVAILDMDENSIMRVSRTLREALGAETMSLALDLKDEASLRSVPEKVLERFGGIHILVNCAALVGTSDLKGWATPFSEQSPDIWRQALEVNLTAPFVLVQTCAPALAASGHGSIINIGSIYGVVGPDLSLYEGTPLGNPAAYAAAKGGLLQFTRWSATVLAPEIRVNAISPGGIWRNQAKSFHERYVMHTPLKRMGSEEDLKGAVAYLASDLSAYVTGQNILVDGGWTAW